MQKEKLSAFMDGEMLDGELVSELATSTSLQQTWENYHLIRDSLRGDTAEVLHFDISAAVMSAIAKEPARETKAVAPLITEQQPTAREWSRLGFLQKMRPWAAQITQVGVAACVSLAVIVGVQQYNGRTDSTAQPEGPVFNTLPMMGKPSPVSYGAPTENVAGNGQQQYQEQRRRINAMLQDYELQRRLHSEQLQFEQNQSQQAAVQIPGNQILGTQPQ